MASRRFVGSLARPSPLMPAHPRTTLVFLLINIYLYLSGKHLSHFYNAWSKLSPSLGSLTKGFVMDYTLKYLIVEDDDIDRLSVETEADKFPFLKRIASCGQVLEAIELITESRPDVLFLDIEMPGMNGIALVKMLAGTSIIPVFITSHPEFAIE